jgi:hypothetical protein
MPAYAHIMLDETFLSRLRAGFPSFYERVSREAIEEADRLRAAAGGDLHKALLRARFDGASELWWPYVKGSIPMVGDDRAAMEGFARLVLTVDHLVGYAPPTMEAARDQVEQVLRSSLDVERMRKVLGKDTRSAGEGAAASAGIVASIGALWAPFATFRRFRGAIRFVPPPLRIAIAAVVVGALASIPVVAAYSASRQAERSARAHAPEPIPATATPATSAGSNGAGHHVPLRA